MVHERFVFEVFTILHLFQNFSFGEVSCLCRGFPYGVAFDCGDVEAGFVFGGHGWRLDAARGCEDEDCEEEEKRDDGFHFCVS